LILILFALINFSEFPFSSLNLFTLLWAFPVVILVHYSVSFKRIHCLNNNTKDVFIKWIKILVFLYIPYIIIAVIYENLVFIIELAGNTANKYDLIFMNIDGIMFSVQPTIWLQKLMHPVAVEYFMIAYSMFFIYPFFYLIYLLQKNKIEYFQKVMFAEILMLIVSLSCFVIFPTLGPRFILDSSSVHFIEQTVSYSENLQGIEFSFLYDLTGYKSFYSMQVDLWNYLERIKTDCFPSLHTGLCLLCLLYAIRYRDVFKNKKLALWFWIVGVISLIISTVYLRYHWVIDVIAGIILTIIVYYISEWIINSWINYRKKQNLKFDNLLENK